MGGNYEKVDRLTNEVTAIKREHKKEIEILQSENQQLKKENAALREENHCINISVIKSIIYAPPIFGYGLTHDEYFAPQCEQLEVPSLLTVLHFTHSHTRREASFGEGGRVEFD